MTECGNCNGTGLDETVSTCGVCHGHGSITSDKDNHNNLPVSYKCWHCGGNETNMYNVTEKPLCEFCYHSSIDPLSRTISQQHHVLLKLLKDELHSSLKQDPISYTAACSCCANLIHITTKTKPNHIYNYQGMILWCCDSVCFRKFVTAHEKRLLELGIRND